MQSDKQRQNIEKYKWRPGQSGNPNGRPKSKTISEMLLAIGTEEIQSDLFLSQDIKNKFKKAGSDATKINAVLRMVYMHALKGQSWAVNFIADRTEGKAPETIKITDDRVVIDIEDDDESDEENLECDTNIDNTDRGGDCDGSV